VGQHDTDLASFVDDGQLVALAEPLRKSGYGDYLVEILRQRGEDTGFNHRTGRWSSP